MKIAFLFDAMLYGGIERVGINYLKILKEEGHDVEVFILNTRRLSGIVDEIPSDLKVYKVLVNKYMCPNRYWYLAKRWWWGKFAFPIAHTFAYIFLRIYGLRFLIYGKYDLAISMAGHTSDLSINAYNIIRSEKKLAWLHGALYEYMIIDPGYERLYSKIKNIVTLNDFSEGLCFFFNKYLKINSRKIFNPCYIENNLIDDHLVNEIKAKYGEFILMVGRMTAPKNPIGLMKAIEYIYEKYGVKYNTVFLGDGDKMNEYKEYAAKSQIADCFHLIGNVPEPQSYYKAAKMFGFSSFSEGLPTVIVEAMCFGLPIDTSDTNVREILDQGKYGLISPIDDEVGLGENIHQIMSNPEVYKKYSELSIQRFEAFKPETIKAQFTDFLLNLK